MTLQPPVVALLSGMKKLCALRVAESTRRAAALLEYCMVFLSRNQRVETPPSRRWSVEVIAPA
jgi:hypothetical protein